jgi:glucose/arabinose dehydrogenase
VSGIARLPRLAVAVLALAALLAACGSRDEGELSGGHAAPASTTVPAGSVPPDDGNAAGPGATSPGSSPAPGPGPGGTTAPPAPPGTAPPAPASQLANVDIRLTKIATLSQPEAMAVRAGDGALYVAEKRGRVRAIRNGAVDPTPVLDISADVSTGTEQGLLGLTFSPDGARLYVDYTDTAGNTRIVEYTMAGGQVDPASRRELLLIDQPSATDNGGGILFGPDGRLWIGMGDGATGGDPADNAQNLNSLLGKMLRIDPAPGSNGVPYSIPAGNPFAGGGAGRPEIWAYGLRNPIRFSFDRTTGDLWIGDVGQSAREEIDFQPAGSRGGQNYGWSRLEGTRPFQGAAPANAVPPIYDYAKAGGNCGVTGGYVYRGSRISGLGGAYIFGDYCVGQIRALRQSGGQVVDERVFTASVRLITAFGQDASGELYVLSLDGGVYRIDAA